MGNDMSNCVQLCPSSQLQEVSRAKSNNMYGAKINGVAEIDNIEHAG